MNHTPDLRPRWLHKKTFGVYVIIGTACLQTAENEFLDQQELTLYQSVTGGCVFARPTYEFQDGRFERLPQWSDDATRRLK